MLKCLNILLAVALVGQIGCRKRRNHEKAPTSGPEERGGEVAKLEIENKKGLVNKIENGATVVGFKLSGKGANQYDLKCKFAPESQAAQAKFVPCDHREYHELTGIEAGIEYVFLVRAQHRAKEKLVAFDGVQFELESDSTHAENHAITMYALDFVMPTDGGFVLNNTVWGVVHIGLLAKEPAAFQCKITNDAGFYRELSCSRGLLEVDYYGLVGRYVLEVTARVRASDRVIGSRKVVFYAE